MAVPRYKTRTSWNPSCVFSGGSKSRIWALMRGFESPSTPDPAKRPLRLVGISYVDVAAFITVADRARERNGEGLDIDRAEAKAKAQCRNAQTVQSRERIVTVAMVVAILQ